MLLFRPLFFSRPQLFWLVDSIHWSLIFAKRLSPIFCLIVLPQRLPLNQPQLVALLDQLAPQHLLADHFQVANFGHQITILLAAVILLLVASLDFPEQHHLLTALSRILGSKGPFFYSLS
jgi:hypothetical protein